MSWGRFNGYAMLQMVDIGRQLQKIDAALREMVHEQEHQASYASLALRETRRLVRDLEALEYATNNLDADQEPTAR